MALPWVYFFHPKIPWSYEPLQLVRGARANFQPSSPHEQWKKGPWLVRDIGDEKLPIYIGVIINLSKDPY